MAEDLLEQIIQLVPPPSGDPEAAPRALIMDSWFDNYVGVISLVRMVDGALEKGQKIKVMSTGVEYGIDDVRFIDNNKDDGHPDGKEGFQAE